MRKSLLALSLLAATSAPVMAADYSDGDIHKNDYKWMQFNYMYSIDEMPKGADDNAHDYLEMEFGGRSGIVEVFNLANDKSIENGAPDKMFMKFAPRMSLDAVTGKDLSFGPVQELYIASLMEWGGNNGGVNNQKIGLGSDVMVPWLGKIGLNLYSTYDGNNKGWNGFQISTNWFKPFYFFDNGSFISYQGYIDYQFGMDDDAGNKFGTTASNGGAMFNGIYWHSDRFAVGYGLKAYKEVYGVKDTVELESTGVSHYLAVTYKF
ncbi:outer membrane protein OmpK [Vibrio alginolyticus]|uniref:nucleoside-specific channel-forming Tsx family protein n=1 Tax=Vibrio alginolyticus TaxID=663 RepID=UPI003B675D66